MKRNALASVLSMLLLFGCQNASPDTNRIASVQADTTVNKDISLKVGQILTCNDSLINCKIDQQDKETEIYVFNIAFIGEETAVVHSFSSAGHTDEGLSKVSYKFKDGKLVLSFPDQELITSGMPSDITETEWEVEAREKLTIVLDAMPCGGQYVFKVANESYYCGLDVQQEYYESFDAIEELIKSPSVKEKLALIKVN